MSSLIRSKSSWKDLSFLFINLDLWLVKRFLIFLLSGVAPRYVTCALSRLNQFSQLILNWTRNKSFAPESVKLDRKIVYSLILTSFPDVTVAKMLVYNSKHLSATTIIIIFNIFPYKDYRLQTKLQVAGLTV